MKNLHIILSVFFLWIVTSLSAQDYSISKKYYTIEDGLSGSQVYDIYKDSKGFMWFLTTGGVDRYDGLQFEHFEVSTSIQTLGGFNFCYEDIDRNIWLSLRSHRFSFDLYNGSFSEINILNTLTKEEISFEEKFPDCPFTFTEVTYIKQDEKRVLWLALANGQAWKYDGEFQKIYDNENTFPILSISPTPFNTVSLGVENTILEIDKKGDIINVDSIPGKVLEHWVDEEGMVWVVPYYDEESTVERHHLFVKHKGQKIIPYFSLTAPEYKNLDVENSNFKEDTKGRIWVNYPKGTYVFDKYGVLIYDLSNELGKPGEVRSIRADYFSDDIVWLILIENDNQGVLSLSLKENHFKKYLNQEKPPYSFRGMIDVNDSIIKVNTYSGDLLLNINNGISEKVRGSAKTSMGFGLTKDSAGIIYTGIHGPLMSVLNTEEGEGIHQSFNSEIGDFFNPFIDKNQKLWIGGTEGLGYLNNDSLITFDKFNNFPKLEKEGVFHFYESQEGLWIATSNGIYLMDYEKGMIYHHNEFVDKIITYIHEDTSGVFWLGTSKKGLIKWNRETGVTSNFTKKDGLSDNWIHAIFKDDYNALWLSSNYGLMRFDKSSESIISFFEKDGIACNEFNRNSYYQHANGTIYFGGVNGLTTFHPKDFIAQNKFEKIKPVVTKFEKLDIQTGELVNQTEVFLKEGKINLQSDDKSFIVNFANLDFSHLYHKRHAYKIEDLDDKWISIKENFVRVNQLPYGDFKLKIKSISKGGAWSDVLEIPITVAKPFYLNPWFIAIAIVGSLFLIGGFIRLRTYQLSKQAEALTIEVFRRTKIIEEQKNELEKSNKIKGKFLRLIGHDLKTPLISLNGMAKKIEFLIKEERYDDIAKLSASIDKSSSSMTTLLDNLLNWALIEKNKFDLKPEALQLDELVTEVTSLYSDIADSKKINFEINNLNDCLVYADRNAVLTILRNLFDNAIKYTPAESSIKLKVAPVKEMQGIRIENFGKTINEEIIQNVFNSSPIANKKVEGLGLLICKELTELNNGVFSIFNEDDIKIIASLELPKPPN